VVNTTDVTQPTLLLTTVPSARMLRLLATVLALPRHPPLVRDGQLRNLIEEETIPTLPSFFPQQFRQRRVFFDMASLSIISNKQMPRDLQICFCY
jgi:hypothetical protein